MCLCSHKADASPDPATVISNVAQPKWRPVMETSRQSLSKSCSPFQLCWLEGKKGLSPPISLALLSNRGKHLCCMDISSRSFNYFPKVRHVCQQTLSLFLRMRSLLPQESCCIAFSPLPLSKDVIMAEKHLQAVRKLLFDLVLLRK